MVDVLKAARDKQLGRCLPDLFDYKTLIYIGCKLRWNYPTFRGQDKFDAAHYEVSILELFPKNLALLKKANKKGHKFLNGYRPPGMFKAVIEGDVRDIKKLVSNKYDIVMWWQGPEHLPLDELPAAIDTLFSITEKILVLGCPCGGITKEHPMAEKVKPEPGGRIVGISAHLSIFAIDYFEDRNFSTDLVGKCGEKGNNLLAWRRA